VEEEHVDEELFSVDVQWDLAADEREPGAKLDHEPLDLCDQRMLETALIDIIRDAEKLEVVVLADDLLDQLALRRGEGAGEVRERAALAFVQARGDVVFEQLALADL
jgi:hypothetical protein